MSAPECASKDEAHTWGKWQLFEKKNTQGWYVYAITTQKRQCETCGLTQFLAQETDKGHPTS